MVGCDSGRIGRHDCLARPPLVDIAPPGHTGRATTILTQGVLMFAIGLERIVYTRKYDGFALATQRHIAEMRSELQTRSGVMHLKGQREVYVVSERLVRESNSRIQAFILGSGRKAPREWAQAVTDRLRASKKSGAPIKYETVIGIDFNHLPVSFASGVEKRREQYTSQGVGDLSSLWLLNISPHWALRCWSSIGATWRSRSRLTREVKRSTTASFSSTSRLWHRHWVTG